MSVLGVPEKFWVHFFAKIPAVLEADMKAVISLTLTMSEGDSIFTNTFASRELKRAQRCIFKTCKSSTGNPLHLHGNPV